MRVVLMFSVTVLVGFHAQAGERVIVYIRNGAAVPDRTLRRAEGIASGMFSHLGVRIDWRIGRSQREAITVGISENTPLDYHRGALAFALPYEGVHIVIFYDRIRQTYAPDVAPALLAHVLVHEITHILEGIDRHSETGVMKARWTDGEIAQMPRKQLSFTPDDISLIQSGLIARAATKPLGTRNTGIGMGLLSR